MALDMSQVDYLERLGGQQRRPHHGSPSTGLGYAQVIGSILGPLVAGGTDIYRTYTESKQSKEELKARERELQAMLPVLRDQQKQAALQAAVALRQTQAQAASQASYAPYLLGAVAAVALALVAIAAARGGSRGS